MVLSNSCIQVVGWSEGGLAWWVDDISHECNHYIWRQDGPQVTIVTVFAFDILGVVARFVDEINEFVAIWMAGDWSNILGFDDGLDLVDVWSLVGEAHGSNSVCHRTGDFKMVSKTLATTKRSCLVLMEFYYSKVLTR